MYIKFTTQSFDSTGFPIWTEPLIGNDLSGWRVAQVPLGHGFVDISYQVIFEQFVNGSKPG